MEKRRSSPLINLALAWRGNNRHLQGASDGARFIALSSLTTVCDVCVPADVSLSVRGVLVSTIGSFAERVLGCKGTSSWRCME